MRRKFDNLPKAQDLQLILGMGEEETWKLAQIDTMTNGSTLKVANSGMPLLEETCSPKYTSESRFLLDNLKLLNVYGRASFIPWNKGLGAKVLHIKKVKDEI